MIMNANELKSITGGRSGWVMLSAVAGGVLTFLFGMLYGIFRPLACNK